MQSYNPKDTEQKWQKYWEMHKTFAAKQGTNAPKFFGLIEFPYPSGAGLHVGHPRSYTAMDVITRKRRMQGYNVLFPIGWDAFGLPTENYAIKTGRPPEEVTQENIANFKRQLQSLGFGFDWDRTVDTTDPAYFKWTQWIFLQLFKQGLAYKKNQPINWCIDCKIGLANEEVIDGRCERCGGPVEKRNKEQWMLEITRYADSLLEGLDTVDYIPQAKAQQTNWIGKSTGAEVTFLVPKCTEILFATSNKSKVARLKKLIAHLQLPIVVHTPEDLGLAPITIEENGTLAENALQKAEAYAAQVSMPVLGLDTGFFINGSEINPITVKRNALHDSDPDTLTQEEISEKMIAYYQSIAHDHGGSVAASFVDNFAMVYPDGQVIHAEAVRPVTLTDHIEQPVDTYFPIRALYTSDATGKYPAQYDDVDEIKEMAPVLETLKQLIAYSLTVFTTRPDTLFGATYCVIAPEHALFEQFASVIANADEVANYIAQAKLKSDLERTELQKEKTGVLLDGIVAINPVNGAALPIWMADYVLTSYGTGAIMAVPAHDARDHAFAKKYHIEIQEVVKKLFGDRLETVEERRDSAKAVIMHEGKVLLIKNIKYEHGYGLPGGGIEADETTEQTITREIIEETGFTDFTIASSLGVVEQNSFFDTTQKFRQRVLAGYLVTLNSLNQQLQSDEDAQKLVLEWVSPKEAIQKLEKSAQKGATMSPYAEFVRRATDAEYCFSGEGIAYNSGFLDELPTDRAKELMIEWLETNGFGTQKINFKLRDWVFSRQRYWGEPIPLVFCVHCKEHGERMSMGESANPGWIPLETADLPLTLPKVERYEPTDTGESPLALMHDWVKTTCPRCGGPASRETDTMPNWAGSSWYFLRYMDPNNSEALAGTDALQYWGQVDWYNGGMEHTVLHLLYSRFWNQFLFDIGAIPHKEPYAKRTSHGMILAKGGEKMSKSKGNVVNPDEMVATYGADALRGYIMFMGPFDQAVEWDTNGLVGVRRFIDKFWQLREKIGDTTDASFQKLLHITIKKVGDDIESMSFNTSIAKLMELVNAGQKAASIAKADFEAMTKILSPFMPHVSEELWQYLGHSESIAHASWPTYDEALLVADTVMIAIQINGKVRHQVEVATDISEDEIKMLVLSEEKVQKWITSAPKKFIYVPGRLVSVVV